MELRRTMMFVPGNNPGMIQDAMIYHSDSIMFDLEDSVSVDQKESARCLVVEALETLDFGTIELIVRINDPSTRLGQADLEAIVPLGKAAIRLPKTDSKEDILFCEKWIEEIEIQAGIVVGSTCMMAAIESSTGVLNAKDIALASKRLIGIALGAEDYVTNMKTVRSTTGNELMFARSMILHAARNAGICAIDTVFSDVNDEEGFCNEVKAIKELGFDGKSIINPRQIKLVNEIFTPTKKEIEFALQVKNAIQTANQRGSGVISLHGKMIDKPVVERAERVLVLAKSTGMWKEDME